jgi:hypothetical protein
MTKRYIQQQPAMHTTCHLKDVYKKKNIKVIVLIDYFNSVLRPAQEFFTSMETSPSILKETMFARLRNLSKYRNQCNQSVHMLCSDAELARRDMGDVTITHIRTPCKQCISISAHVQKMHINDVAMKRNVTRNKSLVKYFKIMSLLTTVILAG